MSLAGVSYSQIPQIERNALIALYNFTNGASWKYARNWTKPAGTEYSWGLLACLGGKVVHLTLTENNLVGYIPTELGNLV